MAELVLYMRPGCHLCERAHALLAPLCVEYGLTLREQSIDGDPELTERYGITIPVAALDGDDLLTWPFSKAEARAALRQRLGRDSSTPAASPSRGARRRRWFLPLRGRR
jgi:glutaredoxin